MFDLVRTDSQLIGSGPEIYKGVKMRPVVGPDILCYDSYLKFGHMS